ncbi:hypothetical protein DFH28DRAFT_868253, partial [Melampsora americana]
TEINLDKATVSKTKLGKFILLVLLSKQYLVTGRPLVPIATHSDLGSAVIHAPATTQASVKYDPSVQSMLDLSKKAQFFAEKNKFFDEKMYGPIENTKKQFDLPRMRLRKLLYCHGCPDNPKGGGLKDAITTGIWWFCIAIIFMRLFQWANELQGGNRGFQMVQGDGRGGHMFQGGYGGGHILQGGNGGY